MSTIRRIAPGHPHYGVPLRRATCYPTEHVTLTTVARKRLHPCAPHRKVGRGKVGVGGKRNDG